MVFDWFKRNLVLRSQPQQEPEPVSVPPLPGEDWEAIAAEIAEPEPSEPVLDPAAEVTAASDERAAEGSVESLEPPGPSEPATSEPSPATWSLPSRHQPRSRRQRLPQATSPSVSPASGPSVDQDALEWARQAYARLKAQQQAAAAAAEPAPAQPAAVAAPPAPEPLAAPVSAAPPTPEQASPPQPLPEPLEIRAPSVDAAQELPPQEASGSGSANTPIDPDGSVTASAASAPAEADGCTSRRPLPPPLLPLPPLLLRHLPQRPFGSQSCGGVPRQLPSTDAFPSPTAFACTRGRRSVPPRAGRGPASPASAGADRHRGPGRHRLFSRTLRDFHFHFRLPCSRLRSAFPLADAADRASAPSMTTFTWSPRCGRPGPPARRHLPGGDRLAGSSAPRP